MSDGPGPLIERAIEPKSKLDAQKLSAALDALAAHDRTFWVSLDPASDQTIIKGISIRQLDRVIARISAEFDVTVVVGSPQIAYREKFTRAIEIDHTHKKQIGGAGEFARLRLRFEPLPTGSGYEVVNDTRAGAIPRSCVPGVERGLDAARENGIIAGYPIVDFRATLVDGAYHEVDSTAHTFEIATRSAMRTLKDRNVLAVYEPIMNVQIMTPDDCLGGVISDLNARTGQVQGVDAQGDEQRITAIAPLRNLLDYDEKLSALSRGRATATTAFSHYDRVPPGLFDHDPPPFRPAAAKRA